MTARMFPVADRHRDRVYVITGGAKGIGRACAERFAAEGAQVMIADIDPAGADLAETLGGVFHRTDMADPDQVRDLAAGTVERFGRIDIWHNNAFSAVFKPIHEQTLDEFDRITGIGIRGYWMGAKVAVEQMRRQGGRGVIVNTASVQSFVGERGFSAYQATKGAVLALTRSLALDHAPDIRSVAIAPGLIATDAIGDIPEDVIEEVLAGIPAGRAARPEEVAALAAFIASEEADYMSGTAVILDGAYLAIG
ncbi:SDR family NAD(P)-dependent oxidoreductase [Rhodophyticola porphyridii]|uniref:SDR family oxidoreductase n=1 Tax=Rhodophyticola porphyridii TaxID=1852017 RepID=A0A3L9Y4F9_9RHOB|nr:SDR family oxidoreductase [Rhodophyticola porphyridii]RMA42325.1 SDR family oxidoreductase [Rhodophyticola porphyridii]